MAQINSDPEVTRHLNRAAGAGAPGAFVERAEEHWERHGFGWFAVESREAALAGACIGFVGVTYPTFIPELSERPELGWRLARRAWGRGYATEAATAARDHAFAALGLAELIAVIHPANARSQRVAAKVGMRVEGRVQNPWLGQKVELWHLAGD